MPDSFDGFCGLWPGADPGGEMRGMHSPLAFFRNVFDACIQFYRYFRISSIAINLTP